MSLQEYQNKFQQSQGILYQHLNKRADAAMELVTALCSYPAARSAVELSLSPLFRRDHTTLYKVMDEVAWENVPLVEIVAAALPPPQKRGFWLLGVDVTPQPRPFARTLADRGYVYQPNAVAGNKPVTIGHQYSTVVLLPEKEAGLSASWVVPLSTQRVSTAADKELVGAQQVHALLDQETAPWYDEVVAEVGDTSYSKPAYLHANRQHQKLVTIVRARSNRTFYQQYEYPTEQRPAHRPRQYGAEFKLPDATTWHPADVTARFTWRSRGGRSYTVVGQGWHDMLMRGKNKPQRLPMAEHPFTLLRVVLYRADGSQAFTRPLWLLVVGEQRAKLSVEDVFWAYIARADIEHFFRFGKQKLLLTAYQTPETVREERWWHLGHIAYAMLWLARHLAQQLPRPWERNLPLVKQRKLSPTLVQRDFARLIQQLGTPARPPKPRGNSPGRPLGLKLPPRPRSAVVRKGKNDS